MFWISDLSSLSDLSNLSDLSDLSNLGDLNDLVVFTGIRFLVAKNANFHINGEQSNKNIAAHIVNLNC